MAQYSKILRGTFTSTGVNKFLSLPMKPDTIEIWNKTKWATTTNHTGVMAVGFAEDANGTAYVTESNGTTWLGKKVTVNGFTFISAGSPTFGATQAMATTFVTQANPANVTVTGHGYNTGDVVWIYGTTGMLQIAGIPYVITKVDANNFTIPVDSSGFAAAATAGNVKQLLYPDLYIPELCYITAVTKAASAVITTNINHSFVVGQEVGFTIPAAWGMTQLDSQVYLQSSNGIPQQAYVTAVTANTVTVNINSTGFSTFAYPTSATAALGLTFPQIYALGDQNTGYSLNASGQVPYLGVNNGVIGIPGAFVANTRQGVIVGTGDGTEIIHANNDVIAWRAIFPDAVMLNQ
jgi:hypothetical protein